MQSRKMRTIAFIAALPLLLVFGFVMGRLSQSHEELTVVASQSKLRTPHPDIRNLPTGDTDNAVLLNGIGDDGRQVFTFTMGFVR